MVQGLPGEGETGDAVKPVVDVGAAAQYAGNLREVIVHQFPNGEKHPVVQRNNALYSEVGHEFAVRFVVIFLVDQTREVGAGAELPLADGERAVGEHRLGIKIKRFHPIIPVVIPLAGQADRDRRPARPQRHRRRGERRLHRVDKNPTRDRSRLRGVVGIVGEERLAVKQEVEPGVAWNHPQDALRPDVQIFPGIQFRRIRAYGQDWGRGLEFPGDLVVLQLLNGGGLRLQ